MTANTCVEARCGDGILNVGSEPCDDGNEVETDACLTGCIAARCGDGVVQEGVEACDDGNDVDSDGVRMIVAFQHVAMGSSRRDGRLR